MKEASTRVAYLAVCVLVGLGIASRGTPWGFAGASHASTPAEITVADWSLVNARLDLVVDALSSDNRLARGISPPYYYYERERQRVRAIVAVDSAWTTKAPVAELKRALDAGGRVICMQPRLHSRWSSQPDPRQPDPLEGVSCVVEFLGADSKPVAVFDFDKKELSLK